ncbi:MAG: helix-turn-helix domain-containing protein [Fibrobacteria bacterium]
MDAEKMSELEALAQSLGNVHAACRSMGVSRSLFYKWMKTKAGLDGFVAAGGGKRRRHPHASDESVLKRVLELAREFPEWGCDRISLYLGLHGESISGTTVQKILMRNGVGRKAQRLMSARSD